VTITAQDISVHLPGSDGQLVPLLQNFSAKFRSGQVLVFLASLLMRETRLRVRSDEIHRSQPSWGLRDRVRESCRCARLCSPSRISVIEGNTHSFVSPCSYIRQVISAQRPISTVGAHCRHGECERNPRLDQAQACMLTHVHLCVHTTRVLNAYSLLCRYSALCRKKTSCYES